MNFRKTPFALAALALSQMLPLGAQTAAVTIEAEGMTRSSYTVEGGLIRVSSGTATGTARQAFGGPSGRYNIQVFVVPENDGRPTLDLFVGATQLQTFTYPLGTAATSFTVSNVQVNNGDELRLVGHPNGGAYARVDKIVLTPVAAAGYQGTPFSGTPVALPKAFPAVNFDKGGEGVAYHDLDPANTGGQFRTSEGVDIATSTDAEGGPYRINSIQAGEWLNYTVEVPADGSYDLGIRAASNQATPAAFRIELDGANKTGTIAVPNTGGWSTFKWVGKQGVALTKGKHVLKVVAETQFFNMNALSVLTPPPPSTGTGGSPMTIEAETMSLVTYASEGTMIRLPSGTSTGTAAKAFSGDTGKYNLQVHVMPESDGRPTLDVLVRGTKMGSYTYPLSTTATSFALNNVTLNKGDEIKLAGAANGGAYGRVDKIVLTPATTSGGGTDPNPLPDPGSYPTGDCGNPSGGYEGFGRATTGGYDKPVYKVTTLNDSGAGSLRDALSQGNRCVQFAVGGTISLGSDLVAKGANITIDGFTAPSPGITVKGRPFILSGSSGASNIVVRGIRHRGSPDDALRIINSAKNIVISKVSISAFGDGAIDVTENSRDVTVEWSVLGTGATNRFISLLAYGASRITFHHNLYYNGNDRQPKCDGNHTSLSTETVCDVRNNVMWNITQRGSAVRGYGTGNIVNNYYQTASGDADQAVFIGEGGVGYTKGNFGHGGWNLDGNGNRSTPFPAPSVTTTDAVTAAYEVVAKAGARASRFGLDATDQGYMGNIKLVPKN
jgi:pectate lyase